MMHSGRLRDHHGEERDFRENEINIGKLSDTELWEAFRKGNRMAFELIYRRNEERLFYYGMKVVADEDLVWDTVQDLFLDLWKKKSGIGEVRVIRSYLYKALRNRLIRNVARRRKILHFAGEEEAVPEPGRVPLREQPEEQEDDGDREKRIRQVLSLLSRKQQELIYLRFYDGLSADEIAGVTGMKRRTVYYGLSRAMELLKGLGKDVFLLVVLPLSLQLRKLNGIKSAR
ncbi:RNA polymerase sigma factor [Sinomicrobium soli]|uniref:RNA polymerase sigma factor n=1 Tax=Sinomicrobium sp. N-1-3-6 TaxID=2219864 RepID=UPI000DCC6332|nr:sigma-70 family RNA polymerase sigma factor [Sinomicrobium sp. N-1-3-6]RAV28487.1 hypothetical protein DN748_12765 [Sinomicrobium sp. N-1-3-6]